MRDAAIGHAEKRSPSRSKKLRRLLPSPATVVGTALGTTGNIVAQHRQDATSQYYCTNIPAAACPLQDVAIHTSEAIEQRDPSALIGYHPTIDRMTRDSQGTHHTITVRNDVTIPYHSSPEYVGSGLFLGALVVSALFGRRGQRNRPQRHNFH